ncbi:hypothetical protein Tco_1456363, partial [Tanacetum coccineum]
MIKALYTKYSIVIDPRSRDFQASQTDLYGISRTPNVCPQKNTKDLDQPILFKYLIPGYGEFDSRLVIWFFLQGYGLEYSELREYTHGFFSHVAEFLEDGMVQYLPHVVPLALTFCNLDDGSLSQQRSDESDVDGALANVLQVLKRVHSIFHDPVTVSNGLKVETIVTRIAKPLAVSDL